MTGVDHDVVTRRLVAIRRLLDHLSTLGVGTSAALEDLAVRLQVERILTQLVNLAAEVNAHVAVTVLDRPPEEYREGFDRMVEAGFLDRDTAARLKPSVGLRNVLTHEYIRVDLDKVARAIPAALTGYGSYVRQVAAALRSDSGGTAPTR